MRSGTCARFTGIQHKGCDVVETYPRPLPCIKGLAERTKAVCEHYVEPTLEQLAEYKAMWRETFESIGRNECPDCHGELKREETSHHVLLFCPACDKLVARGRK